MKEGSWSQLLKEDMGVPDSSDFTPSLETAICLGCGPEKTKKKKKRKEKEREREKT